MCKLDALAHHLRMRHGLRVLLAVSLAGCAGHRVVPPPPAPANETSYESLVARARSGDTLIDFTALRRLYGHTTLPPGVRWDSLIARGEIDSAVLAYYGSARAHEIAVQLFAKRGDRRAAAAEEAIVRGFLRSIETGNGLSTESAFPVYSIQEEYVVMRSRHLRVTQQALLAAKDGYSYDALTGVDSAGRTVTYYFRLLNGL